MASVVYNVYKSNMFSDGWSQSGNIKIMLVDDTYAPDIDNHTVFSDVSGEVSSSGYTSGGQLLTGISIVVDNVGDRAQAICDDVYWSAVTIDTRGAVIYSDTGSKNLIAYIDFNTVQSISNSDFQIQWSTDGVFTVS